VKKDEIWWADLEPPAGRRPVLLLSRDEAYAVRELVTVAPVTTRIRNIPTEVPLGAADGMTRPCVINLGTITTIARMSLRERLVTLGPEKKKAVEAAIHFALGLET
jgi:mRNA interferase MazF